MALEAPATRFSQGSAELVYLCYMAQSGPVASPPYLLTYLLTRRVVLA